MSYHPPTGKHTSSGDETPPIPEEELEQQKIEHGHQMQKEKERQAREAVEVHQLDIELLHQRAIEAEEGQKREDELGEAGACANASCSPGRQRQTNRSQTHCSTVSDNCRSPVTDVRETEFSKPTLTISDGFEISIHMSHDGQSVAPPKPVNANGKGARKKRQLHDDSYSAMEAGTWQASVTDYRDPYFKIDQPSTSSRVNYMRNQEMQGKGAELGGGKSSQMSRSESTISRCTPHTPLGPPDSASVDSNPMPTIYRCRAPIASLDCMDEFSAHSQQMLDQGTASDFNFGRHVSGLVGTYASMPSPDTPGLKHKTLGKSGLRVPNVGLGLWSVYGPNVPDDVSEEIINIAIDNGINLFDLSEAHCAKAEIELGRTLKKRNLKRSSYIITSKIYWSTKSDERGMSRKHIIESVKTSLIRLQTTYIDVLLLHKYDAFCPMEELVRALKYVINQGWVMYWGTARWSPPEIMDSYTTCRQFNCIPPIVEQTEYHMFCRDKVELYMPELFHKIGVGMMAWSAITTGKGLSPKDIAGLFAKSRFNRKYSTFSWCEEDIAAHEVGSSGSKDQVNGEEPRTYADKLRDLTNIANSLDCSLSQLALAWCLKNESINCFLIGANSIEQLKENINALQIVPRLSVDLMEAIEKVIMNKPQKPPMVSTLAMRNQQQIVSNTATPTATTNAITNVTTNATATIATINPITTTTNNAVRIDMTGATTSGGVTPKPETAVEAAADSAGTPGKEDKPSCEIQ